MKKYLLALFIFCALFSKAQNPLVKIWDKAFGGSSFDYITSYQQTADGGFILGGHSVSGIGGDKTQATCGDKDYWIVKIDAYGIKQWDRDFGSDGYDVLTSLEQTSDGGYILGGYSDSDPICDKTQMTIGADDYWIIKIDSLGTKQWDKDFGGYGFDWLQSLKQTNDGGYILGGRSNSGIGGNKTQASQGGYDYWIIKIDSFGIKQWDKDIGGTSTDELYSLQQTNDGGYIIGGQSNSGIGGDKTESTWGGEDYWIVKLDSTGNQQWDKDFGGTHHDYFYTLQQTHDGGYILGGLSASGISGSKTQPLWGNQYYDYWIVKLDSTGNAEWDKDIGGTGNESEWGNISQTSDHGYLLAGTSYSPISGNKTENNLGQEQSWVIKTDSSGNVQWDKTVFTVGHEEIGLAIQTRDGCYAFANFSAAGIGGYKTGGGGGGFTDYWIVKFCDTTDLETQNINQFSESDYFLLATNPFSSSLTLHFPSPQNIPAHLKIFNSIGEVVLEKEIPLQDQTLCVGSFPQGIYFVSVLSEGKVYNQKIVHNN